MNRPLLGLARRRPLRDRIDDDPPEDPTPEDPKPPTPNQDPTE